MDNTDLLIIETLKKNGRASMKQIAKKTGIPITTVHYRLKSMENKKAIRFTARADRKFLGRELMAYILVRVMPGVDHEKIFQEIMKRNEVEQGAVLTGEFDLIFRISVKNMEGMNDFVLKYLRMHKEISETRTMICYDLVGK